MIISLISQKGGVGKSGIARLLAVEFVRAGWSVKIADLDTMQGTSTKWKARRDRAGMRLRSRSRSFSMSNGQCVKPNASISSLLTARPMPSRAAAAWPKLPISSLCQPVRPR